MPPAQGDSADQAKLLCCQTIQKSGTDRAPPRARLRSSLRHSLTPVGGWISLGVPRFTSESSMIISPPEKTFKHNLRWRIALSIPLLAMFTYLAITYPPSQKLDATPLAILAGLVAIYIWAWVAISKCALTVHAEGIQDRTVFGTKEMRWEEIVETRFLQLPTQVLTAHFGLLRALFSRVGKSSAIFMKLTLINHGGRKITLNSNLRGLQEAIRLVLNHVNPRIKDELRRRVQAGDTVRLGKISLSQQGVALEDKPPIPFANIVKCRIEGEALRIKSEGKWLDNIAVNTVKVPNVFAFLDLMDEYKTGARAEFDPLARAMGEGL